LEAIKLCVFPNLYLFGGANLYSKSRGYLNMPDLTDEKFINHPAYGRLYRSGAFGRMLADGSLVYAGRQDDQAKLRGRRVELVEIDAVLLKDTDVRDCATVTIENEIPNQQHLITFWAPSDISEIHHQSKEVQGSVTKRLFEALRERLPSHMIPSALIPIDSIPVTAMQEVDHIRLKELFRQTGPEDLQCFSAGHQGKDDGELTGVEEIAARIIADVAGVPLKGVTRHTSFYALGLNSISAIYVSKRLRESGLGQLDVSTILRHASIAQLSTAIANRDPAPKFVACLSKPEGIFDEAFLEQTTSTFHAIGKPVQSIIPCTPLQEVMLSTRESDNGAAYFNHLLFKVYGNLDTLRATWVHMASRHEILRTCFTTTKNAQFAYAQVILKQVSLPWHHIQTFGDELSLVIEKEKARFVDLTKDSRILPYSFCVLEDKTVSEALLLCSIHHALYDRDALSELFKEVEVFYSSGRLPQTVQFSTFIAHMVRANHEESEEFWKAYLSGFSPKLLRPPRKLGDNTVNPRYQVSSSDLAISLVAFESKCKEISVAPLNVFHAAWARLLSLYTDSSDVCFGNVFSCRTIPLDGVEKVVGPCFNTLPVRIKIPSGAMNVDIMRLGQGSNIDILPYQLSSLRRILKNFSRDGGVQPFDTLIVLHTGAQVLDSRIWKLIKEEGDMAFPIICEITPSREDNKINICLYSDALYTSWSDAEIIAKNFTALLSHTIQYPTSQASDRSILTGSIRASTTSFEDGVPKSNGIVKADSLSEHILQAWSAGESQIREILSGLSGVKNEFIRRDTTIFQLGLDSINAAQVSATLNRFGYDISTGNILEVGGH
jgi:ferricrocin synthase